MPQVRLERLALVCAAVALAACSGKDRTAADSAAMTPAGGAMSSDTGAMSGAAGATGATGGATGSTTDSANRAGAMGGTSGTTGGAAATGGTGGMSGTSGASGTAGAAANQTQSGVTNAKTGSSTLGPNIKKVGPTTATDSSRRTTAHP